LWPDTADETEVSYRAVPDDGAPRSISRRRFLVAGTGVAAVSAAVDVCREPLVPATTAVLGPGKVAVTLRINGAVQRLSVEPRTTLADALRFELGMTGTKVVCDRGACGACTVWLDGVPVCSCTTFALDAAAGEVTTIEGIARGDALHPVQQAFIDHDAMQCGFCTPGLVMSCAALVERVPNATIDDVLSATSGHLCRCGVYPRVFEATLAAASQVRPAPKGG
jgi:xanthine dehydrogenase YagT iron-sulfur-binding subunit